MKKNKKLLLVPSTHWDREWYKTQSEFNVFLTELFDKVLNNLESGGLNNFFTDGQAVIVEDILALKPQWRERIACFAANGKLEIGPFYALTDMYMPSGESFFRNLMYGIEIVKSLGGKPGIPYAPDAFGHNADLPAILNSAGFDGYFFCRGLGDQMEPPRAEFIWHDRSNRYKLLALAAIVDIFHPVTGEWISGAYGLAGYLPDDNQEFCERLKVIMMYLEKYSDLPVQLAINGCDHLLPEDNLSGRLEYFGRNVSDFTAETATIARYVREAWKSLDIDKLPSFSGELVAGRFFRILTGTSSSRVNLKIRNAANQFLLEKIIEPAMVFADHQVRNLYQEHLDNAWKMLLQNQTHDSLCGCSTDAVHREMNVRFDKIESSMTVLAERLLRLHSGVNDLRAIMPSAEAEVIKIAVLSDGAGLNCNSLKSFSIMIPADIDINQYDLIDNSGMKHDFLAVTDRPFSSTNGPFIPSGPEGRVCSRVKIFTAMPLPDGFSSCSASFRKKTSAGKNISDNIPPVSLKNGRLILSVSDFEIQDFISLAAVPDHGDEYDYRSGDAPFEVLNSDWQYSGSRINGNMYQLDFSTSVILPESKNSAHKVTVDVNLQITGSFHDSAFHTALKICNKAKDYRLQLNIKTPFEFTEYCRQSQFYHYITPVAPMPEPDSWRDKTEPLRRNYGFISVSGKEGNFSIMPSGLHEHTTDGKSFNLTLLRAVGNLGNTGAGPAIETPEAQMQGDIEVNCAFSWSGNAAESNAVAVQAQRLLHCGYGVILHPACESREYFESHIALDSAELQISACCKDKLSGITVLRIFNPANRCGKGCLSGKNIPEFLKVIEYHNGEIIETSRTVPSAEIVLAPGEIAAFTF